jgi:cell division protein FtsB
MKKKQFTFWLFLLIFSGYILFSLTGSQGWIALYKNYKQYKNVYKELEQTRQLINSLKTDTLRLTKDTAYIEQIAREKLGMAAKDEKIYKFVKENK